MWRCEKSDHSGREELKDGSEAVVKKRQTWFACNFDWAKMPAEIAELRICNPSALCDTYKL